ncbi:hypothetical protein C8R44DRAFT_890132 [Mycena epipterygia]|nr:hypothetical protein C8R44DRAFT_890132 [Mycena epipterygia]
MAKKDNAWICGPYSRQAPRASLLRCAHDPHHSSTYVTDLVASMGTTQPLDGAPVRTGYVLAFCVCIHISSSAASLKNVLPIICPALALGVGRLWVSTASNEGGTKRTAPPSWDDEGHSQGQHRARRAHLHPLHCALPPTRAISLRMLTLSCCGGTRTRCHADLGGDEIHRLAGVEAGLLRTYRRAEDHVFNMISGSTQWISGGLMTQWSGGGNVHMDLLCMSALCVPFLFANALPDVLPPRLPQSVSMREHQMGVGRELSTQVLHPTLDPEKRHDVHAHDHDAVSTPHKKAWPLRHPNPLRARPASSLYDECTHTRVRGRLCIAGCMMYKEHGG